MSIISEALKKAQENNWQPERKKSRGDKLLIKRDSGKMALRALRNVFGVACIVVATIAVGGSVYFILYEGIDAAKIHIDNARESFPKGGILADKTSDDILGEQSGIGMFAVEERPFHQVGGFTAKPEDPLFILSGIARNEDGYLAVVNDQIIRKGDSIQGAVVVDITMDYVELELNKQHILLEKSF